MVSLRRWLLALPIAVVSLLVATPSLVGAQVIDPLRATVPFPFIAGSGVYPAGTYTFSPSQNLEVLVISSFGHSGFANVNPVGHPMSPDINAKSGDELVFSLREGQYVLSQIWENGTASGEQLAGTYPTKPSKVRNSTLYPAAVIPAAHDRP
jgi:hypothetical protein